MKFRHIFLVGKSHRAQCGSSNIGHRLRSFVSSSKNLWISFSCFEKIIRIIKYMSSWAERRISFISKNQKHVFYQRFSSSLNTFCLLESKFSQRVSAHPIFFTTYFVRKVSNPEVSPFFFLYYFYSKLLINNCKFFFFIALWLASLFRLFRENVVKNNRGWKHVERNLDPRNLKPIFVASKR